MGLQQNTGVIFFTDKTTKRQVMGLVVPDKLATGTYAQSYVDLVASYELEMLPPGVGVQFIYSASPAAATDRYVSGPGLIMFDSQGMLLYTRYQIRLASTLGTRMGLATDFLSTASTAATGPMSQIGVVLYDLEAFRRRGLTSPRRPPRTDRSN